MSLRDNVKEVLKMEIVKDEYKSLSPEQVYALINSPEKEVITEG